MNRRIGIIGTGWAARAHLEALRQIPGAQVAAVAGSDESKAAELARPFGGRGYGDYRSMLSGESLDAVFILTPPHTHGEMEKRCAGKVPAVFVEKPACNDLRTALEIQQAFEEAGTIVSVGYMMRYHAAIRRARELFAESADKPALVSGWWVNPMPGPSWWRNDAQSGGQFVEQCTHLVDAARFIAGDIVRVSAMSARGFVQGVDGYDTDDAMVVNVAFESGAIGSFATGCFPRQVDAAIGMTVQSGSLRCEFAGWGMEMRADRGSGQPEHVRGFDHSVFVAQDTAFLHAAAANDATGILSDYSSAVRTLRVTLAAKESARTGRTVEL